MKNIVLYGLIVTLLFSCKQKEQKPIWLNSKAVLDFHFNELKFSCYERDWKVLLVTSVQPIVLGSSYKNGILKVQSPLRGGVIEGSAEICLTNGDVNYYYPIQLINKKAKASTIVFRSPKTVNPDSSLAQQRIQYQVDEYRNLIAAKNNQLFEEKEVLLPSKTGTYHSEGNHPLTSYYVQAGSCVGIPLKSSLNVREKVFEVTAGPLKDKNENIIADGTLVTFVYQNEYFTKMEVSALKGFAIAKIPVISNYKIYAQIDHLNSIQLFLKP